MFLLNTLRGIFCCMLIISGCAYAQDCDCDESCQCGCGAGGPCKCCFPVDYTDYPAPCPPYCVDDECAWDYEMEHFWTHECMSGVWFPEAPPLFRQLVADPRAVTYSAGWRFNDNLFDHNLAAVSFGDSCPIYRWFCPFERWGFDGMMQFDVEGGLWAIFEQTRPSAPLVNADYYVGFPLTYACGPWSFRLRGYHISSHIGDEFLLNHPGFDRRNASAEYIDFFAAYQPCWSYRIYAGIGAIVRSDDEFREKKLYIQYGGEYYFLNWSTYWSGNRLWGRPFVAAFFSHKADNHYHYDGTIDVGYEFRKMCGEEHALRVFVEWHDGYSVEGQFCRLHTNYVTLRTSYGF